jgi:hypothetical protein
VGDFHPQNDNLERNAKRATTGTELQAWATGLLAAAPTNTAPRVSELGTNFPAQLLGLYHRPPYIQIQVAETNSPGSVYLMWGGGMIGHTAVSRLAQRISSATVATPGLGSPEFIFGVSIRQNDT